MNYSRISSFDLLLKTTLYDVKNEWLSETFGEKFSTSLNAIYSNSKFVTKNFVPQPNNILEPFKKIIPQDVRVIIIGQDPYPRLWDTTGFAFHANGKKTRSLEVIKSNLNKYNHDMKNKWSLESWIKQKILLTNISLTTQEGLSGAHFLIWNEVLKELLKPLPKKSVALMFGEKAKELKNLLPCEVKIEYIHPAERSNEFDRRDVFGEVNNGLKSMGFDPINWTMS